MSTKEIAKDRKYERERDHLMIVKRHVKGRILSYQKNETLVVREYLGMRNPKG